MEVLIFRFGGVIAVFLMGGRTGRVQPPSKSLASIQNEKSALLYSN
jgi:hypothetical protein